MNCGYNSTKFSKECWRNLLLRLSVVGSERHFPCHFDFLILQSYIFSSSAFQFKIMSRLSLYIRLFSAAHGWRYSIFIGIGFMSLFYTVTMFLFIFSTRSIFRTCPTPSAPVSIVTDLYIFILPIVPVSRMQLSRSNRIGIQYIFPTASLYVTRPLCTTRTLSLIYNHHGLHGYCTRHGISSSTRRQRGHFLDAHSSPHQQVPPSPSFNPPHTNLLHSSVELSIGIICSCLSFTPPFFHKRPHTLPPFFNPIRYLLSDWGLLRSSSSDTGGVSRRAPPTPERVEMGKIDEESGKFDGYGTGSSDRDGTCQSSEEDSVCMSSQDN